nr:uncharacterized protein LOC128703594 isoform X2 [Cherax quadricarinatus]
MDEKKEEHSVSAYTSGDPKVTSEEFQKKEELPTLRREQLDTVHGGVKSHTMLAALPASAETLAPTDHIHVQLFDGQVIQITTASLVNSESRRQGARRKEGEIEERRGGQCGSIGSELSTGSAVTILTSDGKTYILPQPLNSEDGTGGGYLITEEVLNAEEVLHSSEILHDEQVLTISSPQSSLEFSSVSRPPDALAIATSEVFNEDYMTLPLEPQSVLTDRAKSFQFKAEGNNSQISSAINKEYMHPRIESHRETESYSDCSIITIHAPCARVKNSWLEKNVKDYSMPPGFAKTEINKEGNDDRAYAGKNKEEKDPVVMSNKEGTSRASENDEKCVDDTETSSYSSVYSKWCEVYKGIPKDYARSIKINTCTSEKVIVQETEKANNRGEVNENKTKRENKNQEKDQENLHKTSIESNQSPNTQWDEDEGTWDQATNQEKLRRSSRIQNTKKIPNEDQDKNLGEPSNRKRQKLIKGDTSNMLWECESCDAMFRTKVSRDRHMQEGHMFTCYICGWKGRSKTKYEVHISTVHCNQQARCLACRKDFASYEAYKQHMKSAHTEHMSVTVKTETECEPRHEETEREQEHQEEARYKGDEDDPDDPDFKDSKAVLGKDDGSHGYRGNRCTYCGKIFLRRSRFLRHLNYHIGNKPFMCTFCNKCFVEKSGLEAHRVTHCPINQPCPQCGKIFKTQRTMRRHLRTHQNKIYTCDFCGKEFRHEESLRVHKSIHKEGGSGNVCKVCEKDCKTPYYLQLHMSTKHEAAKFVCLQCNRSFKWKQSYRKHKAVHHEDTYMKFKCPMCPRHFLTPSELKLHQVVHTNERKYLCDVCGNAFKHEYTRDKHIKTVHQEDREHMCPQCGALFKAKAYLDQHLAHVHTTKERVKCMHCGHDFKTESNLRSHIKVVHKLRSPKYTCKTCSKMFLAPKDLARHSKVHTGVKDYSCPKCCRCFSRKDNMAAHLRTHTTDQPVTTFKHKTDLATSGVSQQTPQGISHILGLPSVVSSSSNISLPNIPVSSKSTVLSNIPVSSTDIDISNITPSSSIVIPSMPALANPITNVSTTSNITTISDSAISSNSLALPNISISSTNVLSNIVSSADSIILSSVPISSTGMSNASVASTAVVFSGIPTPCSLDFSNTHSSSNNMALCHSHTNSSNASISLGNTSPSTETVLSSSPTSSNNVIVNTTPALSSGSRAGRQVYGLHSHVIASSQHQASKISSVLPSSSVPSSVLSLSPHPSSSASILMSQASRTQVVCTSFQPEQVVLTTGVLNPVPIVSTHHTDNSPQYTQLDSLGSSISSSTSTNISTALNSLGSSIAQGSAESINETIGASARMSLDGSHHNSSTGVSSSVLSSPSTLLSDSTLIIPEKIMVLHWYIWWGPVIGRNLFQKVSR